MESGQLSVSSTMARLTRGWQGLDVGAVVHWTGQYEDDNASLTGSTKLNEPRSGPLGGGDEVRARKVSAWTTLDLILNYTFNLPPPAPAEVPGFAKDGGKNVKMKDGKEKNVVPSLDSRVWLQQLEVVAQ